MDFVPYLHPVSMSGNGCFYLLLLSSCLILVLLSVRHYNTFPGKSFTHHFEPTNNANNHTYWPFWITLHKDEDIVEVGTRAVRLIKSVYERCFKNKILKQSQKFQQKEKIRFPTNVNFTKET